MGANRAPETSFLGPQWYHFEPIEEVSVGLVINVLPRPPSSAVSISGYLDSLVRFLGTWFNFVAPWTMWFGSRSNTFDTQLAPQEPPGVALGLFPGSFFGGSGTTPWVDAFRGFCRRAHTA